MELDAVLSSAPELDAEWGGKQPLRESHVDQGSTSSAQPALGTGAFGPIILSLGLSLHWMWRALVRPYLAALPVILHQQFVDWSSMVGYVLILVGGVASAFFFLDYYRAHDGSAGRGVFIGSALLVSFVTSLYLLDWVIFSLYGQLAPLQGGKFDLYPEFVAGEVLAPSLLGVLFLLWGASLIRFAHHRQRQSPEVRLAQMAGRLFFMAAILSFLIPTLTVAIADSLAADDVFYLYGVWILNEGIFSPLNLLLVWAASISAIRSWRASTAPAT